MGASMAKGQSPYQEHPWQPIYDRDSRVLILGTFPSPRSRAEGFYFGHPQNLFWLALADSLRVPRLAADATVAEKTALLLDNHVALWDVLHSCRVEGAADASIRDAVPNRFAPLLAKTQIEAVFTIGRVATDYFNRLAASEARMHAAYLPSTSPANRATQGRPQFAELWGNVGRVLRGDVVSAAGMKAADQYAITQLGIPSLTLMERAAQAVVDELLRPGSRFDLRHVLCVCGTGNNGGDGLAVARLLRQQGVQVEALLVGDIDRLTPETEQQLTWAKTAKVVVRVNNLGVLVGRPPGNSPGEPTGDSLGDSPGGSLGEEDVAAAQIPTTLVDALFGIGLIRPLTGQHLQVVRAMNAARDEGTRIIAVDIPSGVSADSGQALGATVCADATVTFARNKLGMTLEPGHTQAGQLTIADIGIAVPRQGKR